MDLLGGYASDGSDASERSSDKHANETVQAENGPERALISAQDDDASELPSTSGNMVTHSLLSKLPAPKVGHCKARPASSTGDPTPHLMNRFKCLYLSQSRGLFGPVDPRRSQLVLE